MVKINNVSFKYGNSEKFILKDINLYIDKGEYVSILGENGCGKSTLIKLILNLLKPVSGSIDISANKIGYLPQKKENLNDFPITVFELLDSYRRILKIKTKDCVYEFLKKVNLFDYRNKLVGQLSGGQLQKLYIARALIGNPELLLLDEPSTGIDVLGQREIYSFVKNLNTENNLTVISVDHNLDAAILNSTKIFHVKNGGGHLCTPQKYSGEFFSSDFINFSKRNMNV